MELHLNDKKMCDVLDVFRGPKLESVFQAGQLAGLEIEKTYYLKCSSIPQLPEALGETVYLVSGENRAPIEILEIFYDDMMVLARGIKV